MKETCIVDGVGVGMGVGNVLNSVRVTRRRLAESSALTIDAQRSSLFQMAS